MWSNFFWNQKLLLSQSAILNSFLKIASLLKKVPQWVAEAGKYFRLRSSAGLPLATIDQVVEGKWDVSFHKAKD